MILRRRPADDVLIVVVAGEQVVIVVETYTHSFISFTIGIYSQVIAPKLQETRQKNSLHCDIPVGRYGKGTAFPMGVGGIAIGKGVVPVHDSEATNMCMKNPRVNCFASLLETECPEVSKPLTRPPINKAFAVTILANNPNRGPSRPIEYVAATGESSKGSEMSARKGWRGQTCWEEDETRRFKPWELKSWEEKRTSKHSLECLKCGSSSV